MATKKATVKSEAKSKGIPVAKIQFEFPAPEANTVSLEGTSMIGILLRIR